MNITWKIPLAVSKIKFPHQLIQLLPKAAWSAPDALANTDGTFIYL